MGYAKRYTITMTTAADGSGTSYTTSAVMGRISAIQYDKPGSGGFDDGSTMTLTGEKSGIAIWSESAVNADAIRYPRAATHTTAGVAATYDGTRAVLAPIVVAGERLKMVVASGGNAKTATWYVTVE
jgi:hypothetical protein